jgi:hypothetical protein
VNTTLIPLRPSLFALSALLFATTSGFVAESAAQSVRWTPQRADVDVQTGDGVLPEINTTPMVRDRIDPKNYTFAGPELVFTSQGPSHGTFTLANASIVYRSAIVHNRQPIFEGTGKVVIATESPTNALEFRFRLRDNVTLVFDQTSVGPIFDSSNSNACSFLSFEQASALVLERDVDLSAGGNSFLSVGHVMISTVSETSIPAKASKIRISGPYEIKVNKLQFNGLANQTLVLDGSTVVVTGQADSTPFGLISAGGGGIYGLANVNSLERKFTLSATSQGGTVRIAPGATSSFNLDAKNNNNHGAELIIGDPTGQKLTLLLNGTWKNHNYSNDLSQSCLTVLKGAVLGGTGMIDFASPNGSKRTATVSGSIAPGDPHLDDGIGTLSVMAAGLTWNSGADWVFQLKSPTAHDRLAITGDFNRGAGAPSSFTVDFAKSTPAPGQYKLISWTGKTTFKTEDFTTKNLSPSVVVRLSVEKDHLLATIIKR